MSHQIDIYIGKRIRERRNEIGLGQKDLARATGVTFQQIQKYEAGANRVSASRLWLIGIELDVPITYFFSEMIEKKFTLDDASLMTSENMAIIRILNSISDSERAHLISLARALSTLNYGRIKE